MTHTELLDPRPSFARVRPAVDAVVRAVEASDLDRPTPCDDMTVRTLLAHLHMVLVRLTTVTDPTIDPLALPGPDESIADDGWPDAIAAAFDSLEVAWADDALLTQVLTLSWMEGPGAEVLGIYLNEALVHTWDLAMAIGAADDLVAGVGAPDVAIADHYLRTQLPVAERAALWEAAKADLPPGYLDEFGWADPFADAVPVADGAAPLTALVAWNGRSPAWSASA